MEGEQEKLTLPEAEAAFLEVIDHERVLAVFGDIRGDKSRSIPGWRRAKPLIDLDEALNIYNCPRVTIRIGGLNNNAFVELSGRTREGKGEEKKYEIQVRFNKTKRPEKVVGIKETTSGKKESLPDKTKMGVLNTAIRGLSKKFRRGPAFLRNI